MRSVMDTDTSLPVLMALHWPTFCPDAGFCIPRSRCLSGTRCCVFCCWTQSIPWTWTHFNANERVRRLLCMMWWLSGVPQLTRECLIEVSFKKLLISSWQTVLILMYIGLCSWRRVIYVASSLCRIRLENGLRVWGSIPPNGQEFKNNNDLCHHRGHKQRRPRRLRGDIPFMHPHHNFIKAHLYRTSCIIVYRILPHCNS